MNHFSHKHPLKLIEKWEMTIGVGGDCKKDVSSCYGCGESISGGSAYGCIRCHYFLHKLCAELPPTINHYLHFKHSLTLSTPYKHPMCDVCKRSEGGEFTFHCSLCVYDVCIKCACDALAIQEARNVKFEHEGHPQHTLTLQFRRASFWCDACDANDEDLFYQCNDCPFWIHKTCATLHPKLDLPHHHHHPLLLSYSLPNTFYKYIFYCEFCNKQILRSHWAYHCANCRYYAHVKCTLNAMQPSISSNDASTSGVEEQVNGRDFLHFPMSKAFSDPLKQIHFGKMDQDDDGQVEISHWSHDHLLILNVEPIGNTMLNFDCDDPINVCYGCVRPLSFPYYSCKDKCSFTLHKYCAKLPRTLEHQLHPNHLLNLVDFKHHPNADAYKCDGCFIWGNTFVYKCETCIFYLDVNCAFLPNTIKHERHKHPLAEVIDPNPLCKACNKRNRGISYVCKACDFQLDMGCATKSPYFIAHRYCKGHPVPLVYPPVEDHLEDFYCDICEKEMHPKMWLYYCHKCDSTFHLDCIGRNDPSANIYLVDTITNGYHKHPLTYVRRKKTPQFVCLGCNRDINGHLIVECQTGTCPFRLCRDCHRDCHFRKHRLDRIKNILRRYRL